jgi:hypothetical protein
LALEISMPRVGVVIFVLAYLVMQALSLVGWPKILSSVRNKVGRGTNLTHRLRRLKSQRCHPAALPTKA